MKIYLAGPDVFYPNSVEIGKKLQDICENYDCIGLYPADDDILSRIDSMMKCGVSTTDIADMIFTADIEKVREADIVIANLAAFRGPEADPGTAFEMGMAFGMDKPVFAYDKDQTLYYEKVRIWNGGDFSLRNNMSYDKNDDMVDSLGEKANLMLTRGLRDKTVHRSFEDALKAAISNGTL